MPNLRNRHLMLLDLAMIAGAVYISYVLRLEQFSIPEQWLPGLIALTLLLLFTTPLIFQRMGIYSRFWRYASVDELLLVVGAWTLSVLIAWFLTIGVNVISDGMLAIPRSIPLILLLLGLSAIAGPRFLIRISERRMGKNGIYRQKDKTPRRTLIMGAGDAGAMIAREVQENPHLSMHALGFLDDDPSKHGVIIHGLQVLGDRHEIIRLAQRGEIDLVIIAMPTAGGKEIRDVVEICETAGIPTQIVPGVYEVLDNKVSVTQVRSVEIEDLLRRPPIQTDTAQVHELLAGKRVLITGSGGSIGSELSRQIYQCAPAEMILMGHGENSVFNIYNELQEHQIRQLYSPEDAAPLLRPVVADICSAQRVRAVLEEWRPQIVFHAAAHKHVPLMELNPAEAVLNNILGTRTLLQVAAEVGVEQLVMISTDKAVNPTSVMGVTKRVAELLVHQCALQTGKPYVAVRFGNVLGSRGSVIQTFRRQIRKGKAITITHPDMKRYFMTIPEAVQLVLQASVLGKGGEVFVLDMGEPVRIVQLAEDLIRLSGLEVGRDIEIVYTGLRPGEKLFEELFINGENSQRTAHEQIFIGADAGKFVPPQLDEKLERLAEAARYNDQATLIETLHDLVPEYKPLNFEPIDDTKA